MPFFSRLNKPISLSLSSYNRLSSPLLIFVALHWMLSRMSTSFLHSNNQNCTQFSTCGLTSTKQSGIKTFFPPLVRQNLVSASCWLCHSKVLDGQQDLQHQNLKFAHLKLNCDCIHCTAFLSMLTFNLKDSIWSSKVCMRVCVCVFSMIDTKHWKNRVLINSGFCLFSFRCLQLLTFT